MSCHSGKDHDVAGRDLDDGQLRKLVGGRPGRVVRRRDGPLQPVERGRDGVNPLPFAGVGLDPSLPGHVFVVSLFRLARAGLVFAAGIVCFLLDENVVVIFFRFSLDQGQGLILFWLSGRSRPVEEERVEPGKHLAGFSVELRRFEVCRSQARRTWTR